MNNTTVGRAGGAGQARRTTQRSRRCVAAAVSVLALTGIAEAVTIATAGIAHAGVCHNVTRSRVSRGQCYRPPPPPPVPTGAETAPVPASAVSGRAGVDVVRWINWTGCEGTGCIFGLR